MAIISESKHFQKRGLYGVKPDNTTTFQIKRYLHFIKHRKIFYIVTVAIMVVGLAFGVVRGLNYGIDFTGGTMIQVDMGKQVAVSDVEKSIEKYNLDPEIIYSGENNQEIVIRTMEALNYDERTEVLDTLKADFEITDDDVIAQELFGPSVGKELRNNAILAILLSALCILCLLYTSRCV